YYMQDDLGSPMLFTDEEGEIREKYGYDEFGQSLFDYPKGQLQPFGFTGYQMDEAGGLYFAQARRYDAETGRFVSEDFIKGFIEAPFTLNNYGYCWNRPLDLVDLNGLWPSWNDVKNTISNAGTAIVDGVKEVGDLVSGFYAEHKEVIDTVGKVALTTIAVAGVAAITVATGGTATAVISSAIVGAGLEVGAQAADNYFQGNDVFDIHNYSINDILISTVTGAVTGGWGSYIYEAEKAGEIAKKTANILKVVGNGIIAGVSTGISAKVDNPDISHNDLFSRMGLAALLGGVTTLLGERLDDSGISKFLKKMNKFAYNSAKNYLNTPRGKQGIFRLIWTALLYRGGSAVYTVGSSYISRLLNNLYEKYLDGKEEKECIE
ncbi:MAG: hypothetical protein NC313_16735, partial [Butyrivibrio sp.]|nr:hypothetical protein [Butyrivibrio sp.]